MAEIVINDLSKRFRKGDFALRDCTVTMPDARCTVVVGPSGCGKTTLLRLIAGLEQPDRGEIRIGDRVVDAFAPRKRDVAMVFQDFALYPHMRIRQNLAFAARRSGESRGAIDQRIDRAVELLGIAHLLDRKPGELSGGERQRAAIGRVLVRQPACALYDEPLSNLEPGLRDQLRCELKSLHQQVNMTSIFVTHDQEEAMSLADQLVVMADGAIQQVGPSQDVYHNPANRFVAGFIGRPAMNFIDGEIAAGEDSIEFRHSDFTVCLPHAGLDLSENRVVLGLRPDALSLAGPGSAVTCRVTLVESFGSFFNARCKTSSGLCMTARLNIPVGIGDTLSVHIDAAQAHLFAASDAGRSLC